MHISEMAKVVYQNAVEKGWCEDTHLNLERIESALFAAKQADSNGDKNKLAEELADIVVTIGVLAEGLGVSLEWCVVDKMEENCRTKREASK